MCCSIRRSCLQVYTMQRHFCRCMRIRRIVRAARAAVMHQYRTAQDCRRVGVCCTDEPLACMRTTSSLSASYSASAVCACCVAARSMGWGVAFLAPVCRARLGRNAARGRKYELLACVGIIQRQGCMRAN